VALKAHLRDSPSRVVARHRPRRLGVRAVPPRPNPQRRLDLARAAFQVLCTRGVQDVTMRELAEALGVKRPTLYWYFPDLGAIFDVVLADVLGRMRVFLAERMASTAGAMGPRSQAHPAVHPLDALDAYAEAIHAFYASGDAQGGAIFVALIQFWAVSESGEPNRALQAMNAHFLPWRKAAIQMVARGIEDGTVAPCDPAALVDLVAAVIDGCLLHRVSRGADPGPVLAMLRAQVLGPLKRAPVKGARRVAKAKT
jgi:AcrR family transcriptional regulator